MYIKSICKMLPPHQVSAPHPHWFLRYSIFVEKVPFTRYWMKNLYKEARVSEGKIQKLVLSLGNDARQ